MPTTVTIGPIAQTTPVIKLIHSENLAADRSTIANLDVLFSKTILANGQTNRRFLLTGTINMTSHYGFSNYGFEFCVGGVGIAHGIVQNFDAHTNGTSNWSELLVHGTLLYTHPTNTNINFTMRCNGHDIVTLLAAMPNNFTIMEI